MGLNTFADQLHNWQPFFSTVAAVAATLAGLLFVSLSLHREVIAGEEESVQVRLARGSFGDFLYVLMLGLVFLVPHEVPMGLAVALFVLGASRGIGLARQAFRSARGRAPGRAATQALREIALPAIASLGLMVVAIEVARGDMVAVFGLVIVVASLLATASWNAWLILMASSKAER